ncbi:hypothetical protein K488DRAFT_6565, partial [Vararia minispora EC-137]
AAAPTPQEVTRKLSITSVARPKISPAAAGMLSGTESDSDSVFEPMGGTPAMAAAVAGNALSAIAEGARSDLSDEEEGGGWRTSARKERREGEVDLKSGYLWKKCERRPKGWKRRWFVLRSAHIAYYKSSAEYELHRLLDLADVHACTRVALKRHAHAFGLVTASRTYYLRAGSEDEAGSWCAAIRAARDALLAGSGRSSPVPIPGRRRRGGEALGPMTSSESEDASPRTRRAFVEAAGAREHDPARTIVAGYLMKCGQKRRIWRKRWFVLNGEKLMYSASHMEAKPHRQIPLSQVLDAFEYEVGPGTTEDGGGGGQGASAHSFKIVTTARALLLCAPSEEEEIRWVSAVRALLARRTEA